MPFVSCLKERQMIQRMIYLIDGGRGYACVYLILFYCLTTNEITSLVHNDHFSWASHTPTHLISTLTLISKYIQKTGLGLARQLGFMQAWRTRLGFSFSVRLSLHQPCQGMASGPFLSNCTRKIASQLCEGNADAQLRLPSQQSDGCLERLS